MTANDNPSWVEEFIACFDVAKREELEIEKAFWIKAAHLPKAIFKFRSVSEYSLENLRNDTVWLCSPDKYNDPYDCQATISTRELMFSRAEIPEHFFDKLKGLMPEEQLSAALSSENPFDEVVRRVVENDPQVRDRDPNELIEVLKNAVDHVLGPRFRSPLEAVRQSIRMCSFSTENDNILMWSHYANNHQGFCIEYEVKSLPQIAQRLLFPVVYSKKLFDATKFFISAKNEIAEFNNLYGVLQAIYKAEEWSYEHEWRLVFNHGIMTADQNFELTKPTCVYLGARASGEDKARLVDVCQTRGIPLVQMEQAHGEFRITPAL